MAKTASQIIDHALTLIDEQVTEFAAAATTEMSIRELAAEVLPQVARDLIKELPYELKRYLATSSSLVEDVLGVGEDQSSYKKQKVTFKAPSDFWELVAIRLTVWAKPVTSYILINESEYTRQNNPHSRSGKQNPTVAVTNATAGANNRIECFSIAAGDSKSIDTFQYVSFDNIPDDSGNNWPDEIFDEITKALSSELNLIKDRIEQGALRGEDASSAIMQHG